MPEEQANKVYWLALSQDQATMLWWAIWEKEMQLKTRIEQFQHTNWPAECRNAATWEKEVLKAVRENLEKLGQ